MSLKVELETKPGGLYAVKLDGRLDSQTHQQCEDQLNPILSKARILLFDLARLEYISSMGLRLMLRVRKAMEKKGGSVLMTHLQPQIAKVFEIANALPEVPIFASMAEADAYLDAMQRKELEKQGRA